MDIDTALAWAADRRNGALITIRRDGRPQSSDISYALFDGVFHISVTADRAKTKNMRRDNRVVLHISEPGSWSYLSIDGTVELMPAAATPGDATVDALVSYYEAVTGRPHPDWAEYRDAMVRDQRLIVKLTPRSVTGQVN